MYAHIARVEETYHSSFIYMQNEHQIESSVNQKSVRTCALAQCTLRLGLVCIIMLQIISVRVTVEDAAEVLTQHVWPVIRPEWTDKNIVSQVTIPLVHH